MGRHDSSALRFAVATGWTARSTSMRIDVFKWPLPADDNHAISHRLRDRCRQDCPALLAQCDHRAAHKSLQGRGGQGNEHETMVGGLPFWSPTVCARCRSRLYPASLMSSGPRSRTTAISTSARLRGRNVCVKHGTSYSYYDDHLSIQPETAAWASGSRVPTRLLLCATWVVRGGLGPLHKRHTSNEVIAAQWSCPGDMSLEEFRAVGHLRSGAGLQWANISLPVGHTSNRSQQGTLSCHDLIMQACLEARRSRS